MLHKVLQEGATISVAYEFEKKYLMYIKVILYTQSLLNESKASTLMFQIT